MIYCFDIDGVICKTDKLNYRSSQPIKQAIKVINDLHSKGHTIKLFTGRYSKKGKMNKNKIKSIDNGMTKKQLKKWNVKFHSLYFGKPVYDLYIDDKNYNFSKRWYVNFRPNND